MRWVAPSEKDDANHQLEKKLWDAADQFRVNSGRLCRMNLAIRGIDGQIGHADR